MQRNKGYMVVRCVLFVSCALVCGCHKDEITTTPATPTECLLKQVIGNDGTITIARNGKGLPVTLDYVYSDPSHNRTCTIEYDGADNIIKLSQADGYAEYRYDASNKLISGKIVILTNPASPEILLQMSYRYNDQGQIDSTLFDPVNFERYEYDVNGNLSKRYYKYFSNSDSSEYLDYDDKKNVSFGDVFADYTTISIKPVILTGLHIPVISRHNIKNMIVHLSSGSDQNIAYTYTYNELGYPTSSTEVISLPASTYATQFIYDCK